MAMFDFVHFHKYRSTNDVTNDVLKSPPPPPPPIGQILITSEENGKKRGNLVFTLILTWESQW